MLKTRPSKSFLFTLIGAFGVAALSAQTPAPTPPPTPAPAPSPATGSIVLSYDLFSRSPLDENFNPDTDTVSNGNLISAPASVTVAVPEPATWTVLLAGLGVLGWRARVAARRF